MLNCQVVVCLIIRSQRVFDWLGDKRIIDRNLALLQATRGIDRIVCLADKRLLGKAKEFAERNELEIAEIPNNVNTDREIFTTWFQTHELGVKSDIIAVVVPTNPFLPSGKLEQCISNVRKRKCSTSLLARSVSVASPTTANKVKSALALDTIRVFRPNTPPSVEMVAINLLESLNVERQDEYVLASAMIDSDHL